MIIRKIIRIMYNIMYIQNKWCKYNFLPPADHCQAPGFSCSPWPTPLSFIVSKIWLLIESSASQPCLRLFFPRWIACTVAHLHLTVLWHRSGIPHLCQCLPTTASSTKLQTSLFTFSKNFSLRHSMKPVLTPALWLLQALLALLCPEETPLNSSMLFCKALIHYYIVKYLAWGEEKESKTIKLSTDISMQSVVLPLESI